RYTQGRLMEILWYGHSCFRLSERGKPSVITDPFDESIGYPVPRWRADVVTVSHEAPGHANVKAVKGRHKVFAGPGEYEVGGLFITGIRTYRDTQKGRKKGTNTVYLFDFNGLTICHLGDLGHVPTQAQVEALSAVDILLIPVGGGGGLNAAQASEVISLLEPRIVIPMHYKTQATRLKLEPVDRFLKAMGLGELPPQPSLKVTAGQLPEETQVVLLDYVHS
ncbi:MAG: lactamase, partial [Chloroflexi bacterium]